MESFVRTKRRIPEVENGTDRRGTNLLPTDAKSTIRWKVLEYEICPLLFGGILGKGNLSVGFDLPQNSSSKQIEVVSNSKLKVRR